MFAIITPDNIVDQTELPRHGNGDDPGWLALTSTIEDKGHRLVVTVVPGGLDLETEHADIPSLCTGAADTG